MSNLPQKCHTKPSIIIKRPDFSVMSKKTIFNYNALSSGHLSCKPLLVLILHCSSTVTLEKGQQRRQAALNFKKTDRLTQWNLMRKVWEGVAVKKLEQRAFILRIFWRCLVKLLLEDETKTNEAILLALLHPNSVPILISTNYFFHFHSLSNYFLLRNPAGVSIFYHRKTRLSCTKCASGFMIKFSGS